MYICMCFFLYSYEIICDPIPPHPPPFSERSWGHSIYTSMVQSLSDRTNLVCTVPCTVPSTGFTDLFETVQAFVHGLRIRMCFGLRLFCVVNLVLVCLDIIQRVDALCVQLLLPVLTILFDIVHAISAWSEKMHVSGT